MQFTEEEDKLINWLRQNYLNIILGLAIGFALVGGYNYYKSATMNSQHQLSLDYEKIVQLYQTEKFNDFTEKAQLFVEQDPKSIYSAMINLYLAKHYHDANQPNQAKQSLSHILNNSESQAYKYISSLFSNSILFIILLSKLFN